MLEEKNEGNFISGGFGIGAHESDSADVTGVNGTGNEHVQGGGGSCGEEASSGSGAPARDLGADVDRISEEVSSFRERLDALGRGERLSASLRELISVVPDADLSILDAEAFEAIGRGENLVLAYLLSERRKREADDANRRNALSAPGSLTGGGDVLYTIDEIKRMDRRTVKKNLDKVLRSLERGI